MNARLNNGKSNVDQQIGPCLSQCARLTSRQNSQIRHVDCAK